jgi:hypothetical protein
MKLKITKKRILWAVESADGTIWGVFADQGEATEFARKWEGTLA